jgi:hypothetical protein
MIYRLDLRTASGLGVCDEDIFKRFDFRFVEGNQTVAFIEAEEIHIAQFFFREAS